MLKAFLELVPYAVLCVEANETLALDIFQQQGSLTFCKPSAHVGNGKNRFTALGTKYKTHETFHLKSYVAVFPTFLYSSSLLRMYWMFFRSFWNISSYFRKSAYKLAEQIVTNISLVRQFTSPRSKKIANEYVIIIDSSHLLVLSRHLLTS
jgi:hypothetical protein